MSNYTLEPVTSQGKYVGPEVIDWVVGKFNNNYEDYTLLNLYYHSENSLVIEGRHNIYPGYSVTYFQGIDPDFLHQLGYKSLRIVDTIRNRLVSFDKLRPGTSDMTHILKGPIKNEPIMKLIGLTIYVFVITMVACGNDNPTDGNSKNRIVTYEEYLMLRPAGHAGAPDLRYAWEIVGDEGKLKSKRGDGFTWIWLNSDGSYVECDFDGPVCFDQEGEIDSNGRAYDVDWCFESFQFMRSCSQSGL